VNLTLYGRDVLQLDVVSNGVLSCIPYVGMFAMASTAKVFDHCRQNDYLPLSILRKIFTGLGMIIPAVCMASLRFVSEKDIIGNVVLLTLGMSGHQLGEAISFCYRNSKNEIVFSHQNFVDSAANLINRSSRIIVDYFSETIH
jgi:hypothetical protein